MLYNIYITNLANGGDYMKKAISEKRTQVYFPNEVYWKIKEQAMSEDKSSAQIIREAVEKLLSEKDRKVDWENDPFFQAVGIFESETGDLSESHDTYLYGVKRKTLRT